MHRRVPHAHRLMSSTSALPLRPCLVSNFNLPPGNADSFVMLSVQNASIALLGRLVSSEMQVLWNWTVRSFVTVSKVPTSSRGNFDF